MKIIKTFLLSVTSLLLAGSFAVSRAADINNGEDVYRKWCTPCHGKGPGHPGTQALEAKYRGDIPAVLEMRSDMTDEFVKQFVRQGVSIMPFFRKTEISDAQLDDLTAYLISKKK